MFIAGCGFVGLATARLFHEHGWEVIAGTHSAESAEKLSGESFATLAVDIGDRAALAARGELRGLDAVIQCASSGRGGAESYRRVYLAGARNLVEVLAPRHLVFTSSTSVYAQNDGAWVTEESEATPERETGRILREAEEVVLAQGGAVARVAGIYGPGRAVLLRNFLSGEARIESDGGRWINQAHRDDIAAALLRLVERGSRGIFNLCDDEPAMQRDVYGWLAEFLQKPLPSAGSIDPHRKRAWTSKRVSNAKLRALGWVPRYPSFRDAVSLDPRLLLSLA